MARVVLLTAADAPAAVAPALDLLPHDVRTATADASSLAHVDAGAGAVVFVDARDDLAAARALCRLVADTAPDLAVVAVVTEGGLVAVGADWRVHDVVLAGAGPAEYDTRIRLALGRVTAPTTPPGPPPPAPDRLLTIDAGGYTARLRGIPLDLTYKEFELLRHLHSAPDHVFTRAQILETVWGQDYYGGTRTVDVHIRRLRAKLGPEHDGLIGTVRNVGYRYVSP